MTIRQFKLYGTSTVPNSAGTITVNGNAIFSGIFPTGADESTSILLADSIDFDDSTVQYLPVVVTVTSGAINYGLAEWDWSGIDNPIYTPEEYAMFYTDGTIVSDLLTLMQSKSVTPWTAEELALFTPTDVTLQQFNLMHTVAEGNEQNRIIQNHGVGPHIHNQNTFSLTGSYDPDDSGVDLPGTFASFITVSNKPSPTAAEELALSGCWSTRSAPMINGSVVNNNTKFIAVTAGQTLEYEQLVTSSTSLLK